MPQRDRTTSPRSDNGSDSEDRDTARANNDAIETGLQTMMRGLQHANQDENHADATADMLRMLVESRDHVGVALFARHGQLLYQILYGGAASGLVQQIKTNGDPSLLNTVRSALASYTNDNREPIVASPATLAGIATKISVIPGDILRDPVDPKTGHHLGIDTAAIEAFSPTFFSSQSAFFILKLTDIRRLGYIGMGSVDISNQWQLQYDREQYASETGIQLAAFGGVMCASLLCVMLDTTHLRDSYASINERFLQAPKTKPLLNLQDTSVTSVTRATMLVLGVTAYMVLWNEAIAQIKLQWVTSTRTMAKPVAVLMELDRGQGAARRVSRE